MTARPVAAAGLIGLLAGLFLILLQHGTRRSGTDLTSNGAYVVTLGARQQACQDQELLPADTGALQMTLGTYGRPGPPVRASLLGSRGEVLTAGGLAPGWRQGVVRIPVARVRAPTSSARVCISNGGPARVALAGDYPAVGYAIEVAGHVEQERRLRIDYLRPGRESWLSMLPTLIYRFSLGKSGLVRHWAWIAVVVLMVLLVAVAVRVVLAEEPGAPAPERPESGRGA